MKLQILGAALLTVKYTGELRTSVSLQHRYTVAQGEIKNMAYTGPVYYFKKIKDGTHMHTPKATGNNGFSFFKSTLLCFKER